MEAEPHLFSRAFAPIAWVSHWACTLRTAMSDKDELSSEVEHIDHLQRREKGAVNALLILACAVFAAASFIFGYDDKIISPVVALPEFVSLPSRDAEDRELTVPG